MVATHNQQLANAAALHIQIEEKKRELDGLNFQYYGECALLEAKATAEYKIVLDRKKFYAKKNKQSDKHIEKTANDFWIPEAARIRDTAIEKVKRFFKFAKIGCFTNFFNRGNVN